MSPPNASERSGEPTGELIGRLPGDAVARFRGDVLRVAARAFDGATLAAGARLALAVSGGPDSMAMLALAAAAFPRGVLAATFDHRLRAASADEAAIVAAGCAALGVAHVTLLPDTSLAGGNVQARAREARYAALVGWAAANGADALLTAHHADDQAETLLMRLNRASGLSGLSAIRAWRFSGAVPILRPLLDWRKAELRAVVAASGLPWVEDPSNADPRHDRSRIRTALDTVPELDRLALARSAAYLADAEEVVTYFAEMLWSERWFGPDRPFAVADQPRELRRRLVRRAIGDTRRTFAIVLPRYADSANVESLLDALEAGRGAVQGGVKVTASPAGWLFRPAPPRRA